jgi:NhaA family Na+:H+ antiporter
VAGLVLGKLIGISLFSRLMVMFKIAQLPQGVTWRHIYGAGMMAGIGFTMSIFISGLAFISEEMQQIAKVGIFTASIVAAIAGLLWLSSVSKK